MDTSSSVIRTARDALLAKVSAFWNANHSLSRSSGDKDSNDDDDDDDDDALQMLFTSNYLKLLHAMSNSIQIMSQSSSSLLTIGKWSRQSPLVNAGYAMRVATLQEHILAFFQFHSCSIFFNVQENRTKKRALRILVLGAGFDVMALAALATFGHAQRILIHVVEIDFPLICHAKKQVIRQDDQILSLLPKPLSSYQPDQEYYQFEFETGSTFTLISADLQDLESLQKILGEVPGMLQKKDDDDDDTSLIPTLVLSELVLAYLPEKSCDQLLEWLCHVFLFQSPTSAMVLYEPIGDMASTRSSEEDDDNDDGNKNHNQSDPYFVTTGYQQAYLEQFRAKLQRGRTNFSSAGRATGSQAMLLYPLASSPMAVANRLQPFRVEAISAALACQYLLSSRRCWWRHPWKCSELFDEHAALRLYLRSYTLTCIFDHDTTSLLPRILCPWSILSSGAIFANSSSSSRRVLHHPSLCKIKTLEQQQTTAVPVPDIETIWITPIQPEDEPQVRDKFTACYKHFMQEYAPVRRLVKRALKTDLAATSRPTKEPTQTVQSAIGRYYQDRDGIFLVAASDSSLAQQSSPITKAPLVVGCIGLTRKKDPSSSSSSNSSNNFEIHRLFVIPEYQSRGIAQQLLDKATRFILCKHATAAISLEATTLALLDPAIQFYQQQGFQLVNKEIVNSLEILTYIKLVKRKSRNETKR